jgi:hypothetical protein
VKNQLVPVNRHNSSEAYKGSKQTLIKFDVTVAVTVISEANEPLAVTLCSSSTFKPQKSINKGNKIEKKASRTFSNKVEAFCVNKVCMILEIISTLR